MADHPLRPANHRRLGRPLPYQLANGTQAPPGTIAFKKRPSFLSPAYPVLAHLSMCYSRYQGRLLTRYSPVRHSTRFPKEPFAFDLHVLSTPPAFVLSQDQTLQFDILDPAVQDYLYSAYVYKSSFYLELRKLAQSVRRHVGPVCCFVVIQFSRIVCHTKMSLM